MRSVVVWAAAAPASSVVAVSAAIALLMMVMMSSLENSGGEPELERPLLETTPVWPALPSGAATLANLCSQTSANFVD